MSKKLLMNNYSENGLMPVTDRLICWLDGRDGSETDSVWKDRSGNGNDFELKGFTFLGEDGWTGTNLKVNFSQYAIKKISFTEEYTIEVDVFIDGIINTEQTVFFYFGDGNTSGQWRECTFRKEDASSSNNFQVMHSQYTRRINRASKRFTLTIMGNRDKIYLYVNNIKIYEQQVTNIISGLTANFLLGCGRKLNQFCKARFNSLKIYDKILTEEEVQQNYEYEQSIERGE